MPPASWDNWFSRSVRRSHPSKLCPCINAGMAQKPGWKGPAERCRGVAPGRLAPRSSCRQPASVLLPGVSGGSCGVLRITLGQPAAQRPHSTKHHATTNTAGARSHSSRAGSDLRRFTIPPRREVGASLTDHLGSLHLKHSIGVLLAHLVPNLKCITDPQVFLRLTT